MLRLQRRRRKSTGRRPGGETTCAHAGRMMRRMGCYPTMDIEEVNMFKDDGTIIHFSYPCVLASEQYNTFVVAGHGEAKRFEEFLPGIISQVGPDYLESMSRIPIPSIEEAAQVLSEVSRLLRGTEDFGPGEAAREKDIAILTYVVA